MRPATPAVLAPTGTIRFPSALSAGRDGLVAIGGNLEPTTLLTAYRQGIFPWFDEGMPPLWWSPDPRAVFEPGAARISRSMRRTLRRAGWRLSANEAFGAVMAACADREEGTWIVPEMVRAYETLHQGGRAHSFEVWQGPQLVGGLYGVHLGGFFAAESMFHRETGASKAALLVGFQALMASGIELIDVQLMTDHLQSLGAVELSRGAYIAEVTRLRDAPVVLGLSANALAGAQDAVLRNASA